MRIFFLLSSLFASVFSYIFCVMGFLGKDIFLDPEYLGASDEEKEKMNKDAYRLQGTILFLLIGISSNLIFLQMLLRKQIFYYIGIGTILIGITYALISHYLIKKNNKNGR